MHGLWFLKARQAAKADNFLKICYSLEGPSIPDHFHILRSNSLSSQGAVNGIMFNHHCLDEYFFTCKFTKLIFYSADDKEGAKARRVSHVLTETMRMFSSSS